MRKQPSSVKRSELVPCAVGGRSQRWLVKSRPSGLVSIHPAKETWKRLAAEVIERMWDNSKS